MIALALAIVAGCGSAPPPIAETPVPSTSHDPTSWTPTASSEATTGEQVALVPAGDAEQARASFRALVIAVRDSDEQAIRAAFAERIVRAQPGITYPTWTRDGIVDELLAGAAAAHVERDTPFEDIVDPATIRVTRATEYFPSPPSGVLPSDQVVQFAASATGRRLLRGLETSTIVIRCGPTPLIVAR